MPKPRPTEVKLVASLLDPDGSGGDDAKDLAIEIIEALDKDREKREEWVVINRVITGTPLVVTGKFTTKNAAIKYAEQLPFNGLGQHSDVGAWVKVIREPVTPIYDGKKK